MQRLLKSKKNPAFPRNSAFPGCLQFCPAPGHGQLCVALLARTAAGRPSGASPADAPSRPNLPHPTCRKTWWWAWPREQLLDKRWLWSVPHQSAEKKRTITGIPWELLLREGLNKRQCACCIKCFPSDTTFIAFPGKSIALFSPPVTPPSPITLQPPVALPHPLQCQSCSSQQLSSELSFCSHSPWQEKSRAACSPEQILCGSISRTGTILPPAGRSSHCPSPLVCGTAVTGQVAWAATRPWKPLGAKTVPRASHCHCHPSTNCSLATAHGEYSF